MKTILKTFLFLFIVAQIGCNSDDDSILIDGSNKLIGYWINPISNESELQFERAEALKKDAYGISFLAKGKYIERSSGWCGTPPLIYTDYQGTWTKKDSIITIKLDNGINDKDGINWKIITVNDKYLIIERIE